MVERLAKGASTGFVRMIFSGSIVQVEQPSDEADCEALTHGLQSVSTLLRLRQEALFCEL